MVGELSRNERVAGSSPARFTNPFRKTSIGFFLGPPSPTNAYRQQPKTRCPTPAGHAVRRIGSELSPGSDVKEAARDPHGPMDHHQLQRHNFEPPNRNEGREPPLSLLFLAADRSEHCLQRRS